MSSNHKRKFMDGDVTPVELWRRVVMKGKKCVGCAAPPVVTCRIYMPLQDVVASQAMAVGRVLAHEQHSEAFAALCVEFRDGVYVRTSEVHACAACRQVLEREAAKAPSWCCVEFSDGPGAGRIVSGPEAQSSVIEL